MNSQIHPRRLCCCLAAMLLLASSTRGQDSIGALKSRVVQVEQKLNEHLVVDAFADRADVLREIVRQSFDARQALHRAQLELLEKRVDLLRTDIKRRDTLAQQIITKRVKDLLQNESTGDPREKNQRQVQSSSDSQDAAISTPSADVDAGHESAPDQESEYQIFYLEKVAAKDAYYILSEFAADWEGIRMARDDRLNSLVIKASPKDMQRLIKVIEVLDGHTDGSKEKTLPLDVSWPEGQSTIKQYTVQGDRGRLLLGLTSLFQGSESVQVFPSGEQRIVVVGNEGAQMRSLAWLKASDAKVAYLVAIPSEVERKRLIVSTEERLQQLDLKRAELAERFGSKHPSLKPVLHQFEELQKLGSELNKDHVVYNVYLAPGKRDTIDEVIGALPKKATVKWRVHPRGHLEINGPRDDVVQYGDQLVEFMNLNRPAKEKENGSLGEPSSKSGSVRLQLDFQDQK